MKNINASVGLEFRQILRFCSGEHKLGHCLLSQNFKICIIYCPEVDYKRGKSNCVGAYMLLCCKGEREGRALERREGKSRR